MTEKAASYHELEQGDIVFVSLNPTKGHEQKGYRPYIVLTKKFGYLNYMHGVAPITSNAKSFPLHITLPDQLATKGEILLEHHRMIDLETREFRFIEKAPKELIEECAAMIKLLY